MKYDVTIVGSGPAGSTTAKFLAEKGFKVILIDKDKFPRDKPCGGGLPIRVLNRFNYLNDERFIESRSYCGIAFSPSLKNNIEVEKKTPVIATILRGKFDFELVKIAKEKGAIIKDGKTVIDFKIFNDKARVFLNDGSYIDSDIIVGADGVWSLIAKKSGLRKALYETGICILQEFEVDEAVLDKYFKKSRKCYVHSRFKNIFGYGWVFPKKEHLNIGIGGVWLAKGKKINLLNYYKKYISFLKKNKLIPEKLNEVSIRGGSLPVFPLKKTYDTRIILVGDAAGFINPITGEGIFYAISSGEIAAKVISEALEIQKFNSGFLSKYQKSWKKDFGKDLKLIFRVITRQRKRDSERLFEIAKKDKILSELFIGLMIGELGIKECRWKVLRRYFFVSLKELF
jgi:geranylgeranyl reductase family protein